MEAAVVQNGDRIWVKNGQIHFANRMYDTKNLQKIVVQVSAFGVALGLYWFADHVAVLYVAASIIGFGLSFSTVAYSVVTQDLFGKRDFAGIYSTLTIFAGLGGALGSPLIAGVYDLMGSYRLAWVTLSLLMVVNVLLINGMFAYKKKHIE